MAAPDGHSVVVGVDGSELSYRALDWAATEAAHRSAVLRVVHGIPADMPVGALDESTLRRGADGLLEAAAEHVRARSGPVPQVEIALLTGRSTARTLIGESYRTSLLVLGTRGHGGFASLLLGSTAVMVTAHAACPTVVIPPRHGPLPEGGSIVVGVDATEASAGPLHFGFDRAADRGLALIAVHTWAPPTDFGAYPTAPLRVDSDTLAEQARERLTETLAPWRNRFPSVPAEERVVQGQALPVLTETSAQDTEVLVVGSRGHGAVAGAVLGSVSQGVLRHARCPVIVAR